MSKAEKRALEAYPISRLPFFPGSVASYDTNEERRMIYEEGYEQAEKDLALTWEDVKAIVETADMMVSEANRSPQELIKNIQPRMLTTPKSSIVSTKAKRKDNA